MRRIFTLQVLIFPILVVFLSAASFFFHGSCGAWQWWLSISFIVVLPFLVSDRTVAVKSDCAFFGLLVLIWLISPVWPDACAHVDLQRYHMPMIRLLAEGWNPVCDPLCEDIVGKLGIELDGMSYMHVQFISKTAAIFCACAYSFVRDPMAMVYPQLVFMILGLALVTWRVFGRVSVAVIIALLLWKWATIPLFVDTTVLIASAGLIFTMFSDMREKKFSLVELGAFTFWMVNTKLPGVFAAFIFWSVFIVAKILRERSDCKAVVLKSALSAVVITGISLSVSFNPYGTSFRDYGHPLYPFQTVDQKKFPKHNLTGDFKVMNEDYRMMGRAARLLNAYTLPRLVRVYYNQRLGRQDFKPHQWVWDYNDDEHGCASPVSFTSRCWIWLTFAVFLLAPSLRPFAAALFVVMCAFPEDYIGFVRYQPWIDGCTLLCLAFLLSAACDRFKRLDHFVKWFAVMLIVFKFAEVPRWAISNLRWVADAEQNLHDEVFVHYHKPPSRIKDRSVMEGAPLYNTNHPHKNNIVLLCRQLNKADVKVIGKVDIGENECKEFPCGMLVRSNRPFPWTSKIDGASRIDRIRNAANLSWRAISGLYFPRLIR